jgi:hypothetical protein
MDEATKRSKAPDSAYLFLQSDRPLFASGCVRWTVHSQSSIAWIFSHRCVPITQFAKCFSGPNLLENRTMWVWLKNRQKSRLCPNKKRDQKVTKCACIVAQVRPIPRIPMASNITCSWATPKKVKDGENRDEKNPGWTRLRCFFMFF